ncbi:MAG: glycosyltransferase, partial [Gammaproteobacteria bacterium]|nr:glycosyltransferase [Gammaproteobacteria bacterium]
NPPKLSVIIPHKSNNFLLFNCLNSFAEKSRYPNYEVIVADTGSSSREQDEIHEYADATMMDVKIVKFDSYHFGRVNNSVAFNHLSADSELILFCNNDIELINDAVTRMVQVYIRYKAICGTVGCRLHFANNTIQHAGIHLARNERDELVIGHKGFRSYYNYFEGTEKNVLGSTAAFLLIERALFEKLTGFNPAYEHCLEDVELNLACLKHGKKNYFAGDAVCYHFESQTRTDSGTITPGDYENLLKFIQKNPCIRDYDYVGPLCSSTQPGYNGGTKNNG